MIERLANGLLAGEECCRSWPRTCADVHAQSSTAFRFCDFCISGPPRPPTRANGEQIGLNEAKERIEKTEKSRGERLKEAFVADLQGEEG